MSYKAFGYAIRDWWGDVIPLALANVLWLVCLVLIVPAPPATAAMFILARRSALREYFSASELLAAIRPVFWRSWLLALVSGLGLVIGVADVLFYSQVVSGLLGSVGAIFLFYLLVIWCQAQCYAWAQLVWRPDLSLWTIERNGLILAARYPLFSLALVVVLGVLTGLALVLLPLLGLVFMALWAAICVRALAALVPDLLPAEDRARLRALAEADAAPTVADNRRRVRR